MCIHCIATLSFLSAGHEQTSPRQHAVVGWPCCVRSSMVSLHDCVGGDLGSASLIVTALWLQHCHYLARRWWRRRRYLIQWLVIWAERSAEIAVVSRVVSFAAAGWDWMAVLLQPFLLCDCVERSWLVRACVPVGGVN